ncbi:MAG: ParB N-terminal domain-containing protein [Oscillospiraceae bacterium]
MAFKVSDNMLGNIGRVADNALKLTAQDNYRFDYISILKIQPSDKNFYRIDDIDELARDIEISGLQHNIVVRKADNDSYELISGERRLTAYQLLYEKHGDKYKLIPAKITTLDDLDAEIALIQSNAQVRCLSPAELFQQVERMKELYKAKKQRGEKVGGRIRELVAADLNMSPTQVGKYEKLSEKLSEEEKKEFTNGNINLNQALDLAEQDKPKTSETSTPSKAPKPQKYIYQCSNCGTSVTATKLVNIRCEDCDCIFSLT